MKISGKLKQLVMIALLSLTASASMAELPSDKPLAFYVNYELTLAPDGSIEKLLLRNSKLSPTITQYLEKSIRSWKFTPGSINEVPQRTESSLWLNVEATPLASGDYALDIVDANTGALGAALLMPPIYPVEAMQRGQEAVLRLQVFYDENGVVSKVERVAKLNPREEKALKVFEQASFKAAKKWRFNPEKIGGRGVAGTSIVPIKFCMQETNCSWYLTGTKEKETLARQLASQVMLGSSQISIQRSDLLN